MVSSSRSGRRSWASTERVVFTVFEDRGVTSVQPEPDIFMQGRALAREVTSEVLAYHRREVTRDAEVADDRS